MRHDIHPNERAFSSKEVAEELGIATATVRRYGQILERNGYEFLKDGDRRIFVQSDIIALQALRDTDKPLDDTAKELVDQQQEKLEVSNETEIAIPDQSDSLPYDPEQVKEILMFLAKELAATREMNVQLTNDMTHLKTTVSRLQQEHHIISSTIGNSAKKTQTKIDKLTEQQKAYYEELLQQEKEKREFLHKELENLRDEMKKEWHTQNDFNQRLEEVIQKPAGKWERLLSIFRK